MRERTDVERQVGQGDERLVGSDVEKRVREAGKRAILAVIVRARDYGSRLEV